MSPAVAALLAALAVCGALPPVQFTRGRYVQSGDAYMFDWPAVQMAADASCDSAEDIVNVALTLSSSVQGGSHGSHQFDVAVIDVE
jgi:hypothetical protein